MGVDGISVLFVLLDDVHHADLHSGVVDIPSRERVADYMIAFLMHGDVDDRRLLPRSISSSFTFFFEGSLIPMFLIIGVWGSEGQEDTWRH